MTAPLLLLLLFISSTRLQTNDDVSPDVEACFHSAILSFDNSHVYLAHYLLFISFLFSHLCTFNCALAYMYARVCVLILLLSFSYSLLFLLFRHTTHTLPVVMLRSANPAITKALQPLLEGPKFAVVYCGNHQYKVTPGDVIAVQRLRAPIGSQIALKKVLMVGGPRFTAIGRPLLENVRVTADVEEQKRMRNVVSLFTTAGRRRMRWVDANHAATILRIREVIYEPTVVGELDKYDGVVLKDFVAEQHPNPVFSANDGYDLYYKKDWDKVENATTFLDMMGDDGAAAAAAGKP